MMLVVQLKREVGGVGVMEKGVQAKQWCRALEHLLRMLIGCGAETLFVWLPRYLHY